MKAEEFEGRSLALLVRICIEFCGGRNGISRDFKQNLDDACRYLGIEPLDRKTEIRSIIYRPDINHSDLHRQILLTTFSIVTDNGLSVAAFEEGIREELNDRMKSQIWRGTKRDFKWHDRIRASSNTPRSLEDKIRDELEDRLTYEFKQKRQTLPLLAKRVLEIKDGSDSQRAISNFSGEYLIFRFIGFKKSFIVSHMRIYPNSSDDMPSIFCTVGPKVEEEYKIVSGVAFCQSGNRHEIMTLGKSSDFLSVRTAILKLHERKGISGDQPKLTDLRGIRLSHGVYVRVPVAHRIYCYRLGENDDTSAAKIGEYGQEGLLQSFDSFGDIDGIAAWLREQDNLVESEL